MKTISCLAALFCAVCCINAQHFCGFDTLLMRVKAHNPNFDDELAVRNQMVLDWLDWRASSLNETTIFPLLNQSNFVIPVVFHVLHDPADPLGINSNVSFTQLQQTIEYLNEAFAGLTAPDGWGTNSNIQFCLAQDPWPFPGADQIAWQNTNEKGVVRVPVSSPGTSMNLPTAYNLAGISSNYFPSSRYLNIIVYDLGETICTLGQGNIPESPEPVMGDVIGSSGYLQNGPQYADCVWISFRELFSGVIAHEVGHFLNLFHTDHNGCHFGDCTNEGDFVCDTPPCLGNIPSCQPDTSINSCNENQPIPNPMPYHIQMDSLGNDFADLGGNFLHYNPPTPTDSICFVEVPCVSYFTPGQVARMQASLSLFRHQLSSAENLLFTGVIPFCQAQVLNGDIFIEGTCAGIESHLYHPLSGSLAIDWDWSIFDPQMNVLASFPDTPDIYFNFPASGVYTIQLITSDGLGNVACQQLMIQVGLCGCNQTPVSPNLIKNSGFEITNGIFTEPPVYLGLGTNGLAFQTCPENNSQITCWETTAAINRIARGYLDDVGFLALGLWSFGDDAGFAVLNIPEAWDEISSTTNDAYVMLHEYSNGNGTFASGMHQYLDAPLSPGHYVLEYQYGHRLGNFDVVPDNFEKDLSIVLDHGSRLMDIANYNISDQYTNFSDEAVIIADDVSDLVVSTWTKRAQVFDIQAGTSIDGLYFGTGGSPFQGAEVTEFKMYLDDICLVPNNVWPLNLNLISIFSECDSQNFSAVFEVSPNYINQANQQDIILQLSIDGPDSLLAIAGGDLDANEQYIIHTDSLMPGNTIQISVDFEYTGSTAPTDSYICTLDLGPSSPGGFVCHAVYLELSPDYFVADGIVQIEATVSDETCDHLDDGTIVFGAHDCISDSTELYFDVYGPGGFYMIPISAIENSLITLDSLDHGTYQINAYHPLNLDSALTSLVVTIGSGAELFMGSLLTQPSCMDTTGSIQLFFSGNATGTENITWDSNLPPGPQALNLSPDSAYTATITYGDSLQCSSTEFFFINGIPGILNTVFQVTNESCPDADNGSIAGIISGLNDYAIAAPIELTISPTADYFSYSGNLQEMILYSLNGLTPDTYQFIVTDSQGCVDSTSFVILPSSLPQMDITSTVVQPNCDSTFTGSISVVATGAPSGTSYIYNWTPDLVGQDSLSNVSALSTGYYSVEVNYEDTLGGAGPCPVTMDFQISQLSAQAIINPVLCHSDSTGSIDITTIGGVEPLSFTWSNFSITEDIAQLSSGAYTLTITDSSIPACTFSETYFVTEPPVGLVALAGGTNQLCVGEEDGTLSAMASGGIIPYSFSWELQGGLIINSPQVSEVSPGIQSLTVTDYNGCVAESIFEVMAASGIELIANISVIDELCGGMDIGAVTVSATGGNAPYSYQWSDPMFTTGPTLGNISAPGGTFEVFVEDSIGCSDQTSISIVSDAPDADISWNVQGPCVQGGLGTIELTVLSPTGTPNFQWTDSAMYIVGTDEDLIDVPSGIYHLTYSDDSGCFEQDIEVNVNDQVQITSVSYVYNGNGTPTNYCHDTYDGMVKVTIEGGTPEYDYDLWLNDNLISNPGFDYVPGDSNSVFFYGMGLSGLEFFVTDSNGCQDSAAYDITAQMLPAEVIINSFNEQNIGCTANPDIASSIEFSASYATNGCSCSPQSDFGFAMYNGIWNPDVVPHTEFPDAIWTNVSEAPGQSAGLINLPFGADDCQVYTMIVYKQYDPWSSSYSWPENENWPHNCLDVQYIAIGDVIDIKLDRIVSPFCAGQNGLGSIYVDVEVSCNEAQTYEWVDLSDPGVVISTQEDLINVPPAEYQLTVTYGPCSETFVYDLSIEHIVDGDPIWDSGSGTDGVITIDPIGNSIITSNQILVFGNEVVVAAGQEWTINDSYVFFTDERALRLVTSPSNESSLTASNTVFSSACPVYWDGIQVTAKISNGTLHQSVLTINAGSVNYAYNGVRNYFDNAVNDNAEPTVPLETGGQFVLTDVSFHNNRRDVFMFNNSTSTLFNSYEPSLIRSISTVDEGFLDITNPLNGNPMDRVTFIGGTASIPGTLYLDGASFRNERVDFLNISGQVLTAIRTTRPITYIDNSDIAHVAGFTRGVRLGSNTSTFGTSTVIDGIEFSCYRGIFSDGILQDHNSWSNTKYVYNCTFQNLPFAITQVPVLSATGDQTNWTPTNIGAAAYGCYFNLRSQWNVQNNVFNMEPVVTPVEHTVGFIANRCRQANILRNNTFTGNEYGAGFYGQNRFDNGGITDGLSYTCNKFPGFGSTLIGNTFDIVVVQGLGNSPYGVPTQGFPSASAANVFAQNALGTDTDDINDGTLGAHTYFFLNDNLIEENVNDIEANGEIDCTEDLIPFTLTQAEAMLASVNNEYNVKRADYDLLVDGGDTESLTEEVINTTFADALATYYELLSKSPNLSEKVLLEAIEKEFDLPNVLVKQILASNPQAAKSAEVLEKMDDKLIPFDEFQKEEIMQGLDWVSQKEMLEAEMGMLLKERAWALHLLEMEIAMDQAITDKAGTYLSFLQPEMYFSDALSTAEIQLSAGDYISAQATIEDLLQTFSLKHDAELEMMDWLEVLEMQQVLEATNPTELTPEQFTTIEDIFLNAASIPATYAYGLLTRYADYEYEEPLYKWDEHADNRSSRFLTDKPTQYLIYPNPTTGLIVYGRNTDEAIQIELANVTGNIVQLFSLKPFEREAFIDLSQLSPGVYLCRTLSVSGELLFVTSIVKQ